MIDRRALIQHAAALLGGTLSTGATAAVLAGCVATPEPQPTPKQAANTAPAGFFMPVELAIASAMSDLIIPRTSTPGALDVGVPAFIDRCMSKFYGAREQEIIRSGLERANSDSNLQFGKSFADASPAQQTGLMKAYDLEAYQQTRRTATDPTSPPHFFRVLKELTTVGFFTSEVGASQVLKYAAVPGPLRYDIPYSEVGRAWAT